MALQHFLLAWALALGLVCGDDVDMTPVQKVIQLIEDLKSEIEGEGKSEEESYGKFKTFCEDTSEEKTKLIKEKEAVEEDTTSDLNSKTADYEKKNTEIQDHKAKDEKLNSEKETNLKECADDKASWETNENELNTAITALKGAVKKLQDTGGEESLLQIDSSAKQGLKLAQAMGLISEKQQAVVAFLQGEGKPWLEDPDAEYNKKEYSYQSMAIVGTLQELQSDFEKELEGATADWTARKKACEEYDAAKDESISSNQDALETAEGVASDLKEAISEAKTKLATTQRTLAEAREYLADLTENCAARAADYKQRTTHRAEELEAINAAIKILNDEVKGVDKNLHPDEFKKGEEEAAGLVSVQQWIDDVDASLAKRAPSFLQEGTLLRRGRSQVVQRKAKAVSELQEAAGRLNSSRLQGLAQEMEDPTGSTSGNTLVVVKKMVEDMITSLMEEADAEAGNKGYCDTELAKAKHERGRRWSKSYKLGLEIVSMDKKRANLVDEMDKLDADIKAQVEELEKATKLRSEEKAENKKTIADAVAGSKGVAKALQVLEDFYKKAAHNHKGIQYKSGHRPEGAPDSGVEGSYGGKQSQSHGIIAMLEVCRDDFLHTMHDTQEEEDRAAEDFFKLDSTAKSEISANKVQLKMSKEEFGAALQNIAAFKTELKDQTKLLNTVLETLEGLKPKCVDNVEPYEVRVAKREQEIDALKTAMCILDPDKVEEMCKE